MVVQRRCSLQSGKLLRVNLEVPRLRRESGLEYPRIAPAGMPTTRVDGPHFRVGDTGRTSLPCYRGDVCMQMGGTCWTPIANSPWAKNELMEKGQLQQATIESICQPVRVIIQPCSSNDSPRDSSRSPLPLTPFASDEDQDLGKRLKKRMRTRQELDELALATRRETQQRLDFGQHFKRPP